MMLFFFQFLIVFSWISASNCCSLWENFVEVQSCIVNNFYRSSIFFFCLIWLLSSSNQVLFYPCAKWKCIPGKKKPVTQRVHFFIFPGECPSTTWEWCWWTRHCSQAQWRPCFLLRHISCYICQWQDTIWRIWSHYSINGTGKVKAKAVSVLFVCGFSLMSVL